jgi:predicted ATPase with chaperone activity
MALGEILMGKNLLDEKQLEKAAQRQKVVGGLLGDNLVALGFISREKLEEILQEAPPTPKSVEETGLDAQFLLNLILKSMYVAGHQTVPEISDHTKLGRLIIEELLQIAKKEALLEVRGAADANFTLLRHTLTSAGRERASEGLRQCQYVGPVPVPLADYQIQTQKQSITNERINAEALTRTLSHLVLSKDILRRLGPAINSGRAILFYGSPGNGKTSIAEAIGHTFKQNIYIPYCVEADGQIIKIFDSAVHTESLSQPNDGNSNSNSIYLRTPEFDPRWVRCYRPVIVSGGELTLQMLDLQFDTNSKYYEAPLQVKATGGVFIIDDFGRQLVRPQDLLNRWIYPLEKKIDYLILHTGKKFDLHFDQLVIFGTNIPPGQLMDEALLRRVHYKLQINPPSVEDYKEIFRRICNSYRLELSDEILSYLLNSFYPLRKMPLACFHPKFIVEHAIAACNFESVPPRLTLELVKDALENLVVSRPTAA